MRIPAVANENLFATEAPTTEFDVRSLLGNEDCQSEVLYAYELGFREQMTDRFSWDVATFFNVYDNLLAAVPPAPPYIETNPWPPHLVLPLTFSNMGNAETYGVELATDWKVSDRSGICPPIIRSCKGFFATSPTIAAHHQCGLRSSWNVRKNLDFDSTAQYVDCLPELDVPSYITMDLRLAWRPRQNLELAVVGQNLLQPYHYEFGPSTEFPGYEVTEVPRGVYGTAAWRY